MFGSDSWPFFLGLVKTAIIKSVLSVGMSYVTYMYLPELREIGVPRTEERFPKCW